MRLEEILKASWVCVLDACQIRLIFLQRECTRQRITSNQSCRETCQTSSQESITSSRPRRCSTRHQSSAWNSRATHTSDSQDRCTLQDLSTTDSVVISSSRYARMRLPMYA